MKIIKRWTQKSVVVVLGLALVATSSLPAQSAPTRLERHRPDVPGQSMAEGAEVSARPRTADRILKSMPDWRSDKVPSGKGTDEVLTLPASKATAGVGLRRASKAPVWIGAAQASAANRSGALPDKVRLTTSDTATASRAGVIGRLLTLSSMTATPAKDPAARGSDRRVTVRVDIAALAPTRSGDWLQRARLVGLPACATTTPEQPQCQQQTPITTTANGSGEQLTAKIALSGTAKSVMALSAGASGSAGDFKAAPTAPSGSWTAGGSGGGFTWSYPIRVPQVAGGVAPSLALSYSSDSVDGRTASTNNQPSWVGEGWDLGLGRIERSYRSCEDDMAGNVNNKSKRQDLCWAGDNATVSFGSHSGQLVQNGSSNQWRLRDDDGTRFEKLTGALDSGDNDKEYWKVTTTDGDQYFFGRGKASAASGVTSSVLTAPVFGNHDGEPCHKGSFADSWCQQAWRWNLDYVVDTHGNTATAYYTKETNRYGLNNNSKSAAYNRAAFLTRVDYGQQFGKETSVAPAKVTFDVAERCVVTTKQKCSTLNKTSASAWPDVPQDQLCTSTTTCPGLVAPTYFSRKRLIGIKTWVRTGTAYAEVERWTLSQSFPDPGDGTSGALWLRSIVHAGAGGVAALPAVTFGGVQLPNRVDGIEDTRGSIAPPLNKWRVKAIDSESGGEIGVSYSAKDCTPSSRPSAQESNGRRCFPVYWSVPFADKPSLNWFHKYVVTAVNQTDLTNAASPPVITSYGYVGGAGWAYDDNKFIKPKHRTWSQWAGYGKVTTTVGSGSAALRTSTLYYRGLDDDRAGPSGGTKSVSVTDTEGVSVPDLRVLRGDTREQITYNGPAGPEVGGSISDAKIITVAAKNADGMKSELAEVTATRGRTRLSNGSYRRIQASTEYDDYGFETQSEDLGDVAIASDDTCARTTYVRNTDAWILSAEGLVEQRATSCDRWPSAPTSAQVLSESRHYYDGLPFGSIGKGDETRVESASTVTDGEFQWFDEGKSTFDGLGREITSTNALGATTRTSYTPAGAGIPVSATTTSADPDGSGPLTPQVATTSFDPKWGTVVKAVAVDGGITQATYDALGRTSQVWQPGRARSQTPSATYSYRVANRAATAVTTRSLLPNGGYLTGVSFYDGLLRAKQTQTQTIDRRVINGITTETPGRLISNTVYDGRGLVYKAQGPTLVSGAPNTSYTALADNQIPSQTVSSYDGAGRVTKQTLMTLATNRWSTSTMYGGDRVMVTPPAGGTATTTITDARGRTTALRQHTGATASGPYDESTYSYTPAGKLATMTDAAGNTWRHSYDLLGRETSSDDPDSGRATKTYDLLDQLLTSTNARGQTLAYTYDTLGRKTSLRDDTASGPLRASWTYDTVKKGHPASSTRYLDGKPVTSKITALDAAGRTLASEVAIPVIPGWIDAPLAKAYKTTNTYFPDGSLESSNLPLSGNFYPEKLEWLYDGIGRTQAFGGDAAWIAGTIYSGYGDLLQTTSGLANKSVWSTWEIDQGTGRTTRVRLDREWHAKADYDIRYGYEDAGGLNKIATSAPESKGVTDTQCFRHDHVQRLVSAWTPSAGDCTKAPSVVGLGGPAPYWQQWSFDAASNRTKEVTHAAAGDTTFAWSLPTQGAGAERPHGATTQTVTAPGAAPTETGLSYDADGNVTARTSTAAAVLKSSAQGQVMSYDPEGRLTEVKTTGTAPSTTKFAYDENGDRLLRADGTGTTLYLGQDEITLTKATGSVNTTRYYSFAGRTVAVRNGLEQTDSSMLWSDLNNTASWQVNINTLAISTKRSLPYGAPRGAASSLRGKHGFVDGLEDAALGMVRLGARDYDPASGRFLSVDPILDAAVPQQWNPYGYGNGNPVLHPDPAGLEPGDGNNSQHGWSAADKAEARNHGHGWGTGGVNTYKTVNGKNRVTYGWRDKHFRTPTRERIWRVRNLYKQARWERSYRGARDRSWEKVCTVCARDSKPVVEDIETELQIGLAISTLGSSAVFQGAIGALRTVWNASRASEETAPTPAAAPAPQYSRSAYTRLSKSKREEALNKSPTCAYCGNNRATQADHVESLKSDWYGNRAWADEKVVRSERVNRPDNTTGACQPCNGSKSAKELGSGEGQWWPPGWPPGVWWPFGGR